MATVMFKDKPVTLLGNEVKVGQAAPDFKIQKSSDMSDYTLVSAAGKTRIIASVPSLDTPSATWRPKDLMRRRVNCRTLRSSALVWIYRSLRNAGAAPRISTRLSPGAITGTPLSAKI